MDLLRPGRGRRWPVPLLSVAVLAMLATALAGAELAPAAAQGAGGTPPATPVQAADVATDTVVVEATAVGTLLSNESVIIRPEIAGRIVEIGFAEGDRVEAGSMLFKLDDSIYAAELADARARLELAQSNYERSQELLRRGAGTARARDEARSDFRVAQAAVQLAEARLAKMTIKAPIGGIAGLRWVSTGDYVSVGQDMVNLEDVQPLKVEFAVPERYLGSMKTGQTVQIVADAFPTRMFQGEIYAVNPQIDPASRSIQVRARVSNDDLVLRPGLFVRVGVELGRREDALFVPEEAIVPRGKDRFVFKVEDGKAVETRVEIGQRRLGRVEVVDGLVAGDVVVTAGQLKIRDGAPVAPVNAPAGPDGAAAALEGKG